MSDETEVDAKPKKKGKLGKLMMIVVGAVALIGGGVGAGFYVASSAASAETKDQPQLVPKSEQKRAEIKEGGGEGGGAPHGGKPTPEGSGGDEFASNYYALEKDFTANLQDSVHFVQVGVAVSTPYDEKVVENLKTNEIAVRSAILLTLGDTTEDQVFTSAGKRQLQARLVKAINETLKQKEGFGGVGNVYFTNFVVQ